MSSGSGDVSPITGDRSPCQKCFSQSHQMSRIVGPISRFFEISFFLKMEEYWAVSPNNIGTRGFGFNFFGEILGGGGVDYWFQKTLYLSHNYSYFIFIFFNPSFRLIEIVF